MHTQTMNRRGMTLIELLTVIAIIGILGAILIPTVGAVRKSARKTSTRAMFAQVIGAVEQFRNEYGYYPNLNVGGANPAPLYAPNAAYGELKFQNGGQESTERLVQALTGRNINGEKPPAWNPRESGNIRLINFYTFGSDQFQNRRLVDGWGNQDIRMFMDVIIPGNPATDGAGDGVIVVPDIGAFVNSTELKPFPASVALTDPARRIRASVVMFSPGEGGSENDVVKSWGP